MAEGDLRESRRLLRRLVNDDEFNTFYLAHYIRFLLMNFSDVAENVAEARKLLAKIEKLEPTMPRTAELRFRVLMAEYKVLMAEYKVLMAQDKKKMAEDKKKMAEDKKGEAVNGLREDVKKRPEMKLAAAKLLENFKEVEAAESVLKQFVTESKQQNAPLLLAEFYARQNRGAEAFNALERDAKAFSPSVLVAVAISVLYTLDEPRREDIQRVRALIEQNKPKGVELLMENAALRNIEGDYSGSIGSYREVLALEPANLLALNNLAFLLAYHEKNIAEAEELIQRAQRRSRSVSTLADTQAMILLANGDSKSALKFFEDAAVDGPTGTTYFHIAWVHDLASGMDKAEADKAKAAMAKARKFGLRPSALHQLERAKHQELLRKYP
jgi:predicted Zn-dependent protease